MRRNSTISISAPMIADDDGARDNAAPEAERAVEPRRQRDGDIGAQHVERAVRDIDDARDAEDQGKPGGDEEQTGCRSETSSA